MSLDNMSTATKMDLFCRSGAPAELMGRHRGDEYEGVWTTGARQSIPMVSTVPVLGLPMAVLLGMIPTPAVPALWELLLSVAVLATEKSFST